MYSHVTNTFKTAVKDKTVTTTARLTFRNFFSTGPVTSRNLVIEKTQISENGLKIEDNSYNDGQLIGTAVSTQIEIEIKNSEAYDLSNKEFDLEVGVLTDRNLLTYEYIPYGKFIIVEYEDLKSSNKYKIIANDYMIKLNEEFNKNTTFSPTFPITAKNFYIEFMSSYGIEVENQELPNQNFLISAMPNFDGYTGRQVLMRLAELFGSYAKINRNNKCQMFLKTETEEQITANEMNSSLEIDKRYGPVNVVTVGLSNVEGENVTLQDDESIATYGETTIRIDDNPFIYTEELREEVIQELFNRLKGFSYIPVRFKLKGLFYTDCGDTIQVENVQTGEFVETIILNQYWNIPKTRQSEIESPALTNTAQKYKYISKTKQAQTRAEIIVDKQNLKMQSIVSQIGDRSNKSTTITQDIDGITSKVRNYQDFTTDLAGVKSLILTKCMAGNLLELHIYGNNSVFGGLYPSRNLYPSRTLYPSKTGSSRISVTNENGDITYYNLGVNTVLRQYEGYYDEYVLEKGNAYVIRRIIVNNDGSISINEEGTIENKGTLNISLASGTNTITIVDYSANMYAKWTQKNYFTDTFANEIEMESLISQTAQEIQLSVSQSLSNYYTKSQTDSKIQLTADSITQTVTSVETRVGNLEEEAISSVDVKYALGTSTTTAPTTGWSTTAPQWQQGKYMWQRTDITYADGTTSTGVPTCIAGAKGDKGDRGEQGVQGLQGPQGEQGIPGTNGTNGQTSYFHIKYSAVANPTSSSQMSETPNNYIGTYVDFTQADSTNPSDYTWSQFKGSQGEQGIAGTNGTDGQTYYLHIKYSDDGGTTFTANTGETPGAYIGVLTNTTQADSTRPSDYTWSQILGDEGVGVSEIEEQYYLSTSNTTQTGGSWKTTQDAWQVGKYIWTRSKVTWTDNTVTYTTPILAEAINNANSVATNANDKVDNMEIGGRNYALGTGTEVVHTNTNSNNDSFALYTLSLTKEQINAVESGKLICSFDMTLSSNITGTSGAPYIGVGQQASPWQRVAVTETLAGTYHKEIKLTHRAWTNNQIGVRVNYLDIGTAITFSNFKVEIGDKYTDWTPAPEDLPTKVEMNSAITQKANEISLTVSAKVGNNEIISKINQTPEQITIDASKINLNGAVTANNYFKINLDGSMETIAGKIAGINFTSAGLFYTGTSATDGFGLWKNGIHSHYGSYIIFHSGGNIENIGNARFRVYQNGNVYASNFNIEKNGALYFWYDNGKIQSSYTKDYVTRYNEDGHEWVSEGRGFSSSGLPICHAMWIQDAQYYQIQDGVHSKTIVNFRRINDEATSNLDIESYADIHVWGNRQTNGVTNSIYIQGYEVATNASDERLKENIKKCEESGIDFVNGLSIISFDWKKDCKTKDSGKHIRFGFGAQRSEAYESTLVNHNTEFDTYQMENLNLIAPLYKAVQELSSKVEKIEKENV